MSNRRILVASEAAYVGPSPATIQPASGTINQLHRVQNLSYDFTERLVPVQQAGQYSYLDQVQVQTPVVNFSTSWIVSNVLNEQNIGLYVSGDQNCTSNILNGTQQEKNYWIRVVPDGIGAIGYSGTDGGVIGLGNMVLASYSTEGKVGGLPTASISLEGLDINWVATGANFDSPAVDTSAGVPVTGQSITLPVAVTGVAGGISALQPGQITVNLNGAGFGVNNVCIQSYNIGVNLSLDPIICLGSKYPTSREIKIPIEAKATVEMLTRDVGSGRLSTLACPNSNYNVQVTLRTPTCDGSLGAIKAQYTLSGAKLSSQKFSNAIGNVGQTMTMDFTCPIGSQTDVNGLFISGSLI